MTNGIQPMPSAITSIWEEGGRYSVAVDNRVERQDVKNSIAQEMLNQANAREAIRKQLPVHGGGYVWFIDRTKIDLMPLLGH